MIPPPQRGGIINPVPYDPQKHHRRSIRLKGYDYTRPGAYFVTLCAQNREMLFDPQPVREMIQRWWDKIPEKFPDVGTDAFVIMPNHIHGIVVLVGGDHVGVDPRVDPVAVDPRVDLHGDPPVGREKGQSRGIAPTNADAVSLADVVQWFKTMTTNEYIRAVKQLGWAPFPGKFWQQLLRAHHPR